MNSLCFYHENENVNENEELKAGDMVEFTNDFNYVTKNHKCKRVLVGMQGVIVDVDIFALPSHVVIVSVGDDNIRTYSNYLKKINKLKIKNLNTEEVEHVDHPEHYTWFPNGIEAIEILKHLNFCIGSSVKYLLRVDYKNDPIVDLRKAKKFIDFEIQRRLEEKTQRRETNKNDCNLS